MMDAPAPHTRSWRKSSRTSLRWGLFLCALLCPLLLAMRCANEDITQRFELHLTTDGSPEIIGVETPYTGRLAADFRIEGQPGEVIVRVQAQTSGDPDIDGCDTMTLGREHQVNALAWDGVQAPSGESKLYPEVGRLTVRRALYLPWEPTLNAYAGVIEAVGVQTLVRVYSSTPNLRMWDLNGNQIPPVTPTVETSCTGVFVTVYEMPGERVRLTFTSSRDTETFAVLEDCTAQRVVQRICPGTAGPIEEHIHALSGEPVLHRLANLGVGDTLIVEGECQGACPANIEVYGWVEPIDCRTNNECQGGRSCTADGWCIKDPPPKCQSAPGISSVLFALLTLAALARRPSRRGRA